MNTQKMTAMKMLLRDQFSVSERSSLEKVCVCVFEGDYFYLNHYFKLSFLKLSRRSVWCIMRFDFLIHGQTDHRVYPFLYL